ncbi:MAG: GTP cyclohydrolase I, partial [Treponemataceae bacterium]|nr:GTP cyclohydrolase I [Treponemataceae bacterium]
MSETQLANIRAAVETILVNIGENPGREGLLETPDRVARMVDEIFEGTRFSNDEIAEECGKTFPLPEGSISNNSTVAVTNIEAFSYCEHHLALMYNMRVSVGYIPRDRIVGLSKIPRIVDLVTRRLQLQEKIGNDIADILSKVVKTEDVIVVISAEHSCLTSRGIKKPGTRTSTIRRGARSKRKKKSGLNFSRQL